jgi:hypothetical protein
MSGLKRISMGDIQKAVAKECLIHNCESQKRITDITEAYIRQLRKDGFYVLHSRTEKSNATRVHSYMTSN